MSILKEVHDIQLLRLIETSVTNQCWLRYRQLLQKMISHSLDNNTRIKDVHVNVKFSGFSCAGVGKDSHRSGIPAKKFEERKMVVSRHHSIFTSKNGVVNKFY